MNFVAIETSSDRLSIAVGHGDQTTADAIDGAGQKNSQLALPMMHRLLKAAAISLNEIDVVVFGQGPGSFTGVRIACGLAQGLAFGLGKPVLAMPSTLVLAGQAGMDAKKIVVAIDARMGEIYFAVYGRDDAADSGFAEIIAPRLTKPERLEDVDTRDMAGIGSAFADPVLNTALRATMPGLVGTPALPCATALLTVARRLYARQGVTCTLHPRDAAPLYLRNHVAMTIDERRRFHETKNPARAVA